MATPIGYEHCIRGHLSAICGDGNGDCIECSIIEIGHDVVIRLRKSEAENKRLQNQVDDLQSGMYINCVYCGHRYGPNTEVPATMADVLKAHVEQCPKHPMSALKAENKRLLDAEEGWVEAQTKLAEEVKQLLRRTK